MIAIVHSIYSQSMHALALNAGSMGNDAGRYCIYKKKTCFYVKKNNYYTKCLLCGT